MPQLVITVDALDPERMATFWAAALHYDRADGVAQYRPIVPRDPGGPKFLFQGVAAKSPGKNSWHLDIDLDPGRSLDDEVDRLVGLGATRTSAAPVEEFGLTWWVLADVEGNVFCVVSPG